MKMKKFLTILMAVLILTSCASSKTFNIDGEKTVVKPYGWANKQNRKFDNVVYEVSLGNVVWSILGFETIVVPVWLTGWQLYQPVRLKTPDEMGLQKFNDIIDE